jgi:transcription initiation factor TFIID subunit 5
MSDSQNPGAGPSQRPNEAGVLRQFVIEYLQQHGFDRALQSLTAPDPANPDAEGEDEPMNGAAGGATGERRPSAGAAGREARFLAPGPLSIEASLKRNIPQAMTGSASTLSDKVNADFEAQALYIIDMMQKRAGGKDAGEDGGAAPATTQVDVPNAPESLLDPSDRVDGYRRYRRWVDNGLDLWKVRAPGAMHRNEVY